MRWWGAKEHPPYGLLGATMLKLANGEVPVIPTTIENMTVIGQIKDSRGKVGCTAFHITAVTPNELS